MRLVFYYDVVCPYAYLGSVRVEAMAARAGVPLDPVPILLGGVFRAIGTPDVPAASQPFAKLKLGRLDLARYAALYGVPLELPAEHPRRSVEAMRLLHAAPAAARWPLTHALYRAYFAEGRDVADRDVLRDLVRAVGLDEALVARVDEPAVKDALRAATDAAIADGVFGVPGFVIVRDDGTRKLYYGQDRMHLVEREVAR
jgi:2-hydroxychromene-2-carboxylate isomerase